ncbi:FxsA family protein [Paenibacillus alkaliterrae]|uniref:FxsA family protein n=1 Tax=Paenibacillus alkaliterrae TaxID=320909 RepID=UPI001F412805|nr:FxsA family protein [Paenibacillus alkaliterrae]MCF2937356.1 FxsA family protein [Paenibacillus alkaliterrae]
MNRWLLAVIIVLPFLELWGILQVGNWLGGWTAFLILMIMGLAGAFLSLAEGRKVWSEAQHQLQLGQIPGRSLLDGICVVAGGLLLLLPGFFSDILGITLLLPATRTFYRQLMLQWIEKRMRGGHFKIGRF